MSFLINPVRDSRYVLRHGYLISNGETNFQRVISGTSANVGGLAGGALNGNIGMATAQTGSTATGRAALTGGRSILAPRDSPIIYQATVSMPTQSTSVEDFDFYVGMHDGDGVSITCVDGLYLLYKRTVSTNWLFAAPNNSTQTLHDSGMGVGISSNYHLCIETIPATGEYVFNLSNGSSTATKRDTINMMSSGRFTGLGLGIFKYAGTTSRSVSCYRMTCYQGLQGSDPQ